MKIHKSNSNNRSEKDLYPSIRDFLIKEKKCFSDYTGFELSLGNKIRVDVYGINPKNNNLYLLEGKKYLDKKPFGNVIFESIPSLDYADYVYVFGKMVNDFATENRSYVEECKSKGIGILLLNENKHVQEYLKPKKIYPQKLAKKEAFYRIFNMNVQKPIADLILQSTYEFTNKTSEKCAKFIDIYNALFSNKEYKELLRKVLGKKYRLTKIGMRKAFQKEYGETYFIRITRGKKVTEDKLCINETTLTKIKPPILLD